MNKNRVYTHGGLRRNFSKAVASFVAAFSFPCLLALTGCAQTAAINAQALSAISQQEASVEEAWGIEIVGVRLSAAGYMLDFRYRVTDPEKALPLLNRQRKPYLVHLQSGAKLLVPSSPKVGPLRQTSLEAVRGRTYFVLFANPGGLVERGNRVKVVIGDLAISDLVVE